MREIHTSAAARELLQGDAPLSHIVFHDLDLRDFETDLAHHRFEDVVFLGCTLSDKAIAAIVTQGALVFPELKGLPFNPYRTALYTPLELFSGFDQTDPCSYCNTPDAQIYRHWINTGRQFPGALIEALARRLHDHAITEALNAFVAKYGAKVVAVMGGHSMLRSDPQFLSVARLSRELAERGYLLASGGGPGAMEATHVGAYFAGREDAEMLRAIETLAQAPSYKDKAWLQVAFEVRGRFAPADDAISVGIPTFLYGHEPPNAFASHIAKYFANSVREDGLVSLATHGIVFAPGSAGTIQEIFQDAAQNHYGTVKSLASPMVFLGHQYWHETAPIFPILERLASGRVYGDLLAITDDIADAVAFIEQHPPRAVPGGGWSFCGAHCQNSLG